MLPLLGVVTLLLSQAPGDWHGRQPAARGAEALLGSFQTTEVWVTLSPVTADTVAGPRFAFQALLLGGK
jgi:hypothetical protein